MSVDRNFLKDHSFNMPSLKDLNGAILIDKPVGLSSFGVVHQVKKQLSQHFDCPMRRLPKVGHGGTLDPFATGLLIVFIGKASKLADYFLGSDKGYEGTIEFGIKTDSADITGQLLESEKIDFTHWTEELVQRECDFFTHSPYFQTPPMFSAKKHQGKPLYRLARKGIEVPREPKQCHLRSFRVVSTCFPEIRFQLQCSSGTYVRTLAEDLAKRLNTLGVLKSLRRTHCGAKSLNQAISLESLTEHLSHEEPINTLSSWVDFKDLLNHFKTIEVSRSEFFQIKTMKDGPSPLLNRLVVNSQTNDETKPPNFLALKHQHQLVGVLKNVNHEWSVHKTFGLR